MLSSLALIVFGVFPLIFLLLFFAGSIPSAPHPFDVRNLWPTFTKRMSEVLHKRCVPRQCEDEDEDELGP